MENMKKQGSEALFLAYTVPQTLWAISLSSGCSHTRAFLEVYGIC